MNADRQIGPADRELHAEETVELTVVARRAGVTDRARAALPGVRAV